MREKQPPQKVRTYFCPRILKDGIGTPNKSIDFSIRGGRPKQCFYGVVVSLKRAVF